VVGAQIIKEATAKSLIILDEIGRGTSTYDGLSLAQAVLEYFSDKVKGLVLFATHYHELTHLESSFSQIKNAHMTVSDREGEIRFLHTLVRGPAKKSYGIQVAELAGLPAMVVRRAKGLLKNIELKKVEASGQLSLLDLEQEPKDQGLEVITKFMQEVKKYPLMKMTPIEAMNQIAAWQSSLESIREQELN
jgi:DNA mismatch repair protein MutS